MVSFLLLAIWKSQKEQAVAAERMKVVTGLGKKPSATLTEASVNDKQVS